MSTGETRGGPSGNARLPQRRWSLDGSRFETLAAYARAVRHGPYIAVSGTVDMAADGTVSHPGDAYKQTLEAFRKTIIALNQLGAGREDVIRTRIFLAPDEDWHGPIRAHEELFRGINPANTSLHVAGFFIPGVLVEVEVDAIVYSDERRPGDTRATTDGASNVEKP